PAAGNASHVRPHARRADPAVRKDEPMLARTRPPRNPVVVLGVDAAPHRHRLTLPGVPALGGRIRRGRQSDRRSDDRLSWNGPCESTASRRTYRLAPGVRNGVTHAIAARWLSRYPRPDDGSRPALRGGTE